MGAQQITDAGSAARASDRREPPNWYHDILRADGSPCSEEESAFIRMMDAYEGEHARL